MPTKQESYKYCVQFSPTCVSLVKTLLGIKGLKMSVDQKVACHLLETTHKF